MAIEIGKVDSINGKEKKVLDKDQQDKYALEDLVDSYGFQGVIGAMAEIAFEKAEHLRVNWQDENAAREMDRIGNYLGGQETNPILKSALDRG